jgi:aspartate racemase
MKTIGLIGGMSWESSSAYYRILNTEYRNVRGRNHSCPSVLYSFDFEQIDRLQHDGDWETLEQLIMEACMKVFMAGAEVIVLCSNTMHKVTRHVERQFTRQFIHIVDATAAEINARKLHKVGLLGTSFTMQESFYKDRLQSDFGIEVVIPEKESRQLMHSIIYTQLVKGRVLDESRSSVKQIIDELNNKGAEGIILGCTEIPMLIDQSQSQLPLFDTTQIHAMAALYRAMEN